MPKINVKVWFVLSAFAVIALVLTACGGVAAPAAAPAEIKTIKLAFPTGKTSFANCDIGVGLDQGFFEEQGIKIETENLGSGLKVVQAVVGNSFDIGGASIEPVINAIAKEQELSVIGTYADRLTVSMVVGPEIMTVADLAGKQLGIQDIGAFREVMTRMVLQSGDLAPEDVNYVSVATPAYIGGLLEGQIQSAVLHAEQVEQILAKDPQFRVLVDLYEVEPDYFYGTYFATDSWLEQNSDVAQGFVTALVKTHRFMYENKDDTVRVCAEVTGQDKAQVEKAWDKYFTKNFVFPVNSGLELDRISYTIDRMESLGTLSGSKPAAADIVNSTFMDQALSELGEKPERT